MATVSETPSKPRPAGDAPRGPQPPRLIAVLDMGASAIRLIIGEIAPNRSVRTIEEASKGVRLGRDTFSSGSIRSGTIDAALSALENFRRVIDGYGVVELRAVATSAVREARNMDLFLDRIQRRTGIAFSIIDEAEESRLLFLAVKQDLRRRAPLRGGWTLLVEVGGGSTSLTLLHQGKPNRSAVYALGAIRLRQQLDLRKLTHDVQVSLLKRTIANMIEEIRIDIPLRRVTHVVAVGGDVRFAAGQVAETAADGDSVREIPRESFLAFCDQVERDDEERLVERFRLPAVEAETLVPSLLVYRALLGETRARKLVVSSASLRTGVLLDAAAPADRAGWLEFDEQVLASAEALGHKHRFDRNHGHHVAVLALQLFDAMCDDHGLGPRERLLLQVASLLHDIGVFVSLRAHHKHSQYLLAASQIFGLSNEETAVVANVARYHRRGPPQKAHLPYVALDRGDRLNVNKLAAILRVANALDAEHLQKVTSLRLERRPRSWVLEIDGTGDLTMEQLAATARADLFADTFGQELVIRRASAYP